MVEKHEVGSDTPLTCPYCQARLVEVGVFEVKLDIPIWTRWRWEVDRWDIADEEYGDGAGRSFECGGCQKTLGDELDEALSKQIA